ncbi:TetR/AcrR family transcriptional regulator [Thalassolituus sp.]|jgi:AcrR family transcriptional regulator|uniref:TetR/AcrR family transcriptional regulator n=1 Tax=Thalassolituus sp. TaxID=2030822 RepID=UPI002A81ADFB|nr:TetR/AcrR family transcriptional regulator [Thalassolituus sp.]|tara:strand:- start:13325 stop:13918 length:594 start_codon:yes stop_codon:yes gene_type:complete
MENIALPQSTSHRTRILESLETCLDAKSFRDITLTDITAAAHISRRTFYEHFTNKDECLLALSEETSTQIMKAILTSFLSTDSWQEKVEKISHAYLEEIQNKTVLMRALYIELGALGLEGQELRRKVADVFADFLCNQVKIHILNGDNLNEISHDIGVIIVSGINQLILNRLLDDNKARLTDLTSTAVQIIYSVSKN